MKDGGVLLQLLPYGWEVYPGQLIRSCISADIPLALHGYYLQVCAWMHGISMLRDIVLIMQ